MTIAEFSITPVGKGESVGEYVARCLDLVDRSGLPYRLNPMGTVVEGPFDEVLDLIARCHKAVAADCDRVSTIIKIDDRKGVTGGLESKGADVATRTGGPAPGAPRAAIPAKHTSPTRIPGLPPTRSESAPAGNAAAA